MDSRDAPGHGKEEEANKLASRRLYEEVFERGNLAAADELMSQDAINHGPGAPPTRGTEQIKRQAMLLRRAMPDLKAILNDQLVDGDRVASRWTGSGTHTGELSTPAGAVPPTGRVVTWDEIRIDRFAGGRIVESWFIPDRLSMWQALGLIPTPGS